MVPPVGGRLEVLARDECLRLLRAHHFGRLAVAVDGQPLVFPVNYAMAGSRVVFRTDSGTKLHAAAGHAVAFEIDHADAGYHEGWSVLVVGTAHEECDPQRRQEFERLPLTPWVQGPKVHWVYVDADAITGRRATHDADL
jgi:nitroimidazol reductase NimA-like FMN-containing flavoprotein (pyridoxamine 5'-phosphate oxidase superfamily)